jgi:hypothetical protein
VKAKDRKEWFPWADDPIDRVAARVTSPGINFEPRRIINQVESDVPLPMLLAPEAVRTLIGTKRGRLNVVGYVGGGKHGARMACRCDCGNYVVRQASTLRRSLPDGCIDACQRCKNIEHLKRQHIWGPIKKGGEIDRLKR